MVASRVASRVASSAESARRLEAAGIDDLRVENYTPAAIAVSVGVWLTMAALFPRTSEIIMLWPLIVGGAAWLGYQVLDRSVRLASAILVFGMLVAETAAIWTFPGTALAVMYAPIVLITSALLGRKTSLLVALVASACIIAAHHDPRQVISVDTQYISLALVWTTCTFSWLTTKSLYTALDWSWYSYLQAEERVEELRRRQGDLVRALKDLGDATYRLENANAELERARSAALEAYHLKAEFASTVSHELRTPLNLIIGFSEMMATAPHTYSGESLPPGYQCDVESIYRNARHLSSLIDDILDLGQIDAGRITLSRETVELATIIGEATRAVDALLEAKRLRLRVEIADNIPRMPLDVTRIRQVLINLFSNAVRFTERGEIAIRAWRDENRVVVAVTDTGIGISHADLPKVFDPFRQADGSIRRRFGGNGLGLAICKEIVELHGGNVWVESEIDQGSTFYFSLPLVENVVAGLFRREWETWARSSPAAEEEQDVVVVVDQDTEGRGFRLFHRYLSGFKVVWARNGAEVNHITGKGPVRAVIFTASRSEAPGLYSSLRIPESVPIITCPLTGPRSLQSELNVVEYLTKPVVVERIAGALKPLKRVRNVLIVDDDPETVRMLGRMVRSVLRRARVVGAYNGADALAAIESMTPDVIFLDLMMPEVDGYAVLEHLHSQERLRNVAVIVVTANGRQPDEVMARSLALSCQRVFGMRELIGVLQSNLSALKRQEGSSDPAPQGATAG